MMMDKGGRKRFTVHERSRSAHEERQREIAKHRRQLEWGRKAGSALSNEVTRRKGEAIREVRLVYGEDDDGEEEEGRMRG